MKLLLVTVDDNTVVPYISTTLNNYELAIKLASRANLPGAEELFINQFNKLFQQGLIKEAAKVAADSPQVNVIQHLLILFREFSELKELFSFSNSYLLFLDNRLPFFNILVFF